MLDYRVTIACDTIAAGETAVDLVIPVRGDRRPEPDETFHLYALATGGVLVDNPVATATIVDDD